MAEMSLERLVVEFIAPEMNNIESNKRIIDIVESEAFERIHIWLAIVALPLKNLYTVSEKEEAITKPTYTEHKVVMVLSLFKTNP